MTLTDGFFQLLNSTFLLSVYIMSESSSKSINYFLSYCSDRQTDKQTDIQTDIHTDRFTDKKKENDPITFLKLSVIL